MRRVPPSIVVAAAANSVIWLAVVAGGALAQSAPWRIVQATDGTIYMLAGGSRFAIVPGRAASVTVQAAPGATCTIGYRTPAGTSSTAQGLGPQMVDGSGVVTWSFLIGTATRPGTGTVTVSCGGASISSPIPIG